MDAKKEKIVNYTIWGFLTIFVLTLNNSIFLNQIGYYGALLALVYKSFWKRENQFQKTGLEIVFLLFISAEILSTIFALDKAQSFNNLLKRILLIPVVYMVFSSINNLKDLKKLFYLFISASVITFTIYLMAAYQHFSSNLYQIESKGPSTFQYVMTAGGLISFTTIFLFAFVVNEKQKIFWKILTFLVFGLSVIALLASYTRAAWIGALAGLFTIILIRRIWIIIFPAFLISLYIFFGIKTVSEIKIIDLQSGQSKNIVTDGRAWNIYADSSIIVEADYEGGINILDSDLNIKDNLNLDFPVVDIKKLNDSTFFAATVNLQFYLFDRSKYILTPKYEFLSKGRSIDFDVYNNKLYVLDQDSGLTIFTYPKDFNYYTDLSKFENISIDNNILAGYSSSKRELEVYSLKDGYLDSLVLSKSFKYYSSFVWISGNNIFMQTSEEFLAFKLSNGELTPINNPNKVSGIKSIELDNDLIYASTFDNRIIKLTVSENTLKSELVYQGEYNISDFYPNKNTLAVTYNKINRFTSIIDPYHDTNLERFNQWSAGIRMFLDYPIFGVGDIDLHKLYKEYKKPYEKFTYGHLHNNYIHLLVILGSFGFVVVMLMLFFILKKHYSIYKVVKNEKFISSISLGALACFIGFLISGLAEWNFGDHEIITMVWFTLSLNLIAGKIYINKEN